LSEFVLQLIAWCSAGFPTDVKMCKSISALKGCLIKETSVIVMLGPTHAVKTKKGYYDNEAL